LAGPALAASCGNDATGFNEWLETFRRDAAAQGISQRVISAALDGVSYDQNVIRRDRNQQVFRQSFEEFSGRMIPPRMNRARSMLSGHAAVLDRAEQQTGVPAEVVVAIWGLESDFGAVRGDQSTLRSLATLAFDCRRSDFFTGQLIDALRVIERGDLTAAQMRGGWHGELGQTQFLPSSYFAFALDFDGDRRRDLINSTADVLASTANYLRGHGWQSGQSWMEGNANFQEVVEQEPGLFADRSGICAPPGGAVGAQPLLMAMLGAVAGIHFAAPIQVATVGQSSRQ
jgi:lytic murein transglycosylase